MKIEQCNFKYTSKTFLIKIFMKKSIIAAAAVAAMVLAGCAKTEVTDVPDAAFIGFDNAYVGNPTKTATEVTTETIDHFMVYGGYDGQQDFNGVKVAPNANGVWTYSPLVKWADEQNYYFYAYYPETLGVIPTYTYGQGLTFTDVVINADHQVDFVYDATEQINSGVEGTVRDKVPFSFEHMLSMVQFTIKSGFPEDVTLTISDFKFYGMNSTGTLTYGTWAEKEPSVPVAEETPITLVGGTCAATEEPANYTDNCIVLPQSFEDDEIYAKFTVSAAGTSIADGPAVKTITAKLPADEWGKGLRYNYIVTIDGQTLDFITFDTPEVSEWAEYEDVDMGNVAE